MCRLLFVKSESEFQSAEYLAKFAEVARLSKEYQGHGWGCAYIVDGDWQIYKNIRPVWEDDLQQFPTTTHLLAHARSAFRDEGIAVENNMPFYDGRYVFIFNGELHGVKLKAEGRIGAEKLFNFIKRFDSGDMFAAISRAVPIVRKKANFIRAMNMIIADKNCDYLVTEFNDDHEYFTIYQKRYNKCMVVCSEQFYGEQDWQRIDNYTLMRLHIG